MLPGFDKIVEERIRDAASRGFFDDLPGMGGPLELEDDSHLPEELRLAYKILKNAGCLPPEIELKKEILRAEELLGGIEDAAERYRAVKRLNFLIMKLNSMRKSNVVNEFPQRYQAKAAECFRPSGVPESFERMETND
jgi:hypothetical protein